MNTDKLKRYMIICAANLLFVTASVNLITATAADVAATSTDAVAAAENTEAADDGKQDDTEESTEEEIIFTPKVIIEKCQSDKDKVYAGDDVKFTVTLKNTSNTKALVNMSIKVTAPENYFTLLDDSDNVYIGAIYAGSRMEISFNYRVNPITPKGQYNLVLDMDYADVKGNSYSCSGNAKVDIYQNMEVSFDELDIAREAKVGEKINASVNAINLGKTAVYNVRAVLECDGLKSAGTLFIGDIEPGNMGSSETDITVTSLPGDELYGDTTGTVTYIYEDDEGNEYTESSEFDFTVNTPFTQTTEEREDATGQWWIIIGVIAGILAGLLTGLAKKISWHRK
jgi:uncharacterized repeat protein (TIGR01451 family)